MPTSSHFNIVPILTVVCNLRPARVLDIGCGFGKYGTLLREYLDVWDERLEPKTWKTRLVGVEGYEGYRSPVLDYVYNEVHYGDATQVVPRLGEFDVILILDVIEHLEKPAAQELVRQCLARSPVVVVSTPLEFYPQEDICGNDLERHRCHWTRTDFPPGTHVRTVRIVACDIFFASNRPLNDAAFVLADPADVVYNRSRRKLGVLGLPLSLGLRWACRWLS